MIPRTKNSHAKAKATIKRLHLLRSDCIASKNGKSVYPHNVSSSFLNSKCSPLALVFNSLPTTAPANMTTIATTGRDSSVHHDQLRTWKQFGADIVEVKRCQSPLLPKKSSVKNKERKSKLNNNRRPKMSASSQTQTPPDHSQKNKLADLEGRLAFVKREHSQILQGLHAEVETLKEKNNELQFQLFVGNKIGTTSTNVEIQGKDDREIKRLRDEIVRLEGDLKEAWEKNAQLSRLVEDLQRVEEANGSAKSETSTIIIQSDSYPGAKDDDKENQEDYEDDISLPSLSETSTSTPTPPPEYVIKLQQAEALIEKLQSENVTQRNELKSIRTIVDQNIKLKFRGCNHPTRLSRRDNPHKTIERLVLESPYSLLRKTRHSDESANLTKSESLDTFPPLQTKFTSYEHKIRSHSMNPELPPVPGSSGSESSQITGSRRMPLNLISLRSDGKVNQRFIGSLKSKKQKAVAATYGQQRLLNRRQKS